jgi:hypothetical protein
MNAESLTSPPPATFTSICIGCEKETSAPVVVGWFTRVSGACVPQYACPQCVPAQEPGPAPDDLS